MARQIAATDTKGEREGMMENMRHWQKLSTPPQWALKPIQAGRLKGKTDINPQWRMMAMTETFGPCGSGWKYTIDTLWLERGAVVKSRENNIEREEVAAFALVSVYYKLEDGWSEPIPGIGGSMFTEMEKSGPFNSDEAFKMAVTDALSVAFKALGVAADIYSGDKFDGSKYQREQRQAQQQQQAPKSAPQSSNSTPVDPKDADYLQRVKTALHTLYGADKTAALNKVEELTSFIPRGKTEAERVKGVRDFTKLTGQRLSILAHSLEKLVPKEQAMCAECRQVGTHSDSCPNAVPPQ